MTTAECDSRQKFDVEKARARIEAIEDGAAPWPCAGPADIRAAEKRPVRYAGVPASLDSRQFSLTVRLLFSAFFTVLLAWLETAAAAGYPMPGFISAADRPVAFLAADTGLLAAVALLCGPDLLKGFRSLFTFRAETDGLLPVAFLGALSLAAYHLARPQSFVKGGRVLDSAAAAAVMTLYLLGRLVRLRQARQTARSLEGSGPFYTLRRVAATEGPALCPVRAGEPAQAPGTRRAATPADAAARVLAPALLLAALGMMGLNLRLGRGSAEAVAAFAAVCCAGVPEAYELCQALPLWRVSHRLRRRHAALTDYAAVKEFGNTGWIVVDAPMLFPPEHARIHGIKTFSGARIEEAIVDAASVVIAVDGPLARAFRSLIRSTEVALLTPERIFYREDQGISATVAGKQVVAGSRDILRSHGIQAPPREYEAKYASMGRDLFYLAENGRLVAMFIVEYGTGKKVVSAFRRLMRAGVSMLVRTSDANISASMIAERFGGRMGGLQMLGGRETAALSAAAAADHSPASLFFDGSLLSYADTLLTCIRLPGTIRAAALVQAAAAAMGAGMAAWLSFHGGMAVVVPVKMLEYQAVWAAAALLIALLRRS